MNRPGRTVKELPCPYAPIQHRTSALGSGAIIPTAFIYPRCGVDPPI